MNRRAPFYLRRTKEVMVYFPAYRPAPQDGAGRPERRPDGSWAAEKIFTKRIPHTVDFQMDGPEFDLYREITRFVNRQSAKAAAQGDDPRARAVGFLMSLYQRRLASSTYAMRRRQELERQRSLPLQAVERIASVLILPHPEREAPDVRRMRPNLETLEVAMRIVMDYEKAQGRQVYDVHDKNLGYDITSLDLDSGELRLIEVKGLAAATGTILLTPNERRVAEDRRDC